MWGTNSLSQRYQSNNKLSFDVGRNNSLQNVPNFNNNMNTNQNELNLLYQTPIKQLDNVPNNNGNITPFRFDFNYIFGNLWSAGHIPNNQILEANMNLSPSQGKTENMKYIEKSYKLSPISQIKSNSSQNNSNNSNKNIVILNPNDSNLDNNKIREIYDIDNCNNINELSKKNLSELFNNAKNEQFLNNNQIKRRNDINCINNTYRNNINENLNINRINEIKKKNSNLQISHPFIFSSPRNIKKPKKIFECSGSTIATSSSNRNMNKKRRFRKNNEQLVILKKFYNEHKYWSKNQIKEISQKIGLKENKVYKWLWDQRNKEIKSTKFVVNKGNSS